MGFVFPFVWIVFAVLLCGFLPCATCVWRDKLGNFSRCVAAQWILGSSTVFLGLEISVFVWYWVQQHLCCLEAGFYCPAAKPCQQCPVGMGNCNVSPDPSYRLTRDDDVRTGALGRTRAEKVKTRTSASSRVEKAWKPAVVQCFNTFVVVGGGLTLWHHPSGRPVVLQF